MCKLEEEKNEVQEFFVLKTECPSCNFQPLHYKMVEYNHHIEVIYKCLVCERGFEVKHKHHKRGD
jgi:DNA-directed RNA polymerase subunit RPC12/RpoP